MQADSQGMEIVGVGRFLAVVRRWWWLLVAVPILTGALAYLLAARQAPLYAATATLFVNPASPSSNDVSAARQLSQSYGELARALPVLERAAAALPGGRSPAELRARTEAGVIEDTLIIEITAEEHSPQLAAATANAIAESLVAWLREQQELSLGLNEQALAGRLSETQADLDAVNAEIATIEEGTGAPSAAEQSRLDLLSDLASQHQRAYVDLLDMQRRLELTPRDRVALTTPATPPGRPISSGPMRAAAIAALSSLAILGAGLVLLERLSDHVRLPTDVRRVQLPVLAALPRLRQRAGIEILSAPDSALSESFRSLRTAIQLALGRRDLGTLAVSGTGQGDGKSTVAANLAIAFAQAGRRVILVDGDMRRPRQGALFGLGPSPGLADLLAGTGTPQELLGDGPVAGLRLLPAGSSPRYPAELLAGPQLRALIGELRGEADVVIIDTPPLLAASDALLLADVSDHALIVARAGQTSAEDLREARTALGQTGVHVLGVVLNGSEDGRRLQAYMPILTPKAAQRAEDGRQAESVEG